MHDKTKIICKDCGSTLTHIIGKLPDVNEFAGKLVSPAIRGGYLVECKNCSIKFRSSEFDQSTLTNMYDGGLSEWEVAENRNDWKMLTSYIDSKYATGISVLDIGCNRGEILAKINIRNERFGVEINTKAAAIANNLDGLTVWNNYKDIPDDKKFDVIFSTDVIEHVTSPTTFLQPLFKLLKDDGILVITTGDANNMFSKLFGTRWWYFYFPEHISFISKKWLKKFTSINNLNINAIDKYYYHNLSIIKRVRLLTMSLMLFVSNKQIQTKILKFIHRTDFPPRFQIGKGVSKDHIFIVLQKK